MEEKGFMTDTAASHKGAIKIFWLQFWGAVMSVYDLSLLVDVAGPLDPHL